MSFSLVYQGVTAAHRVTNRGSEFLRVFPVGSLFGDANAVDLASIIDVNVENGRVVLVRLLERVARLLEQGLQRLTQWGLNAAAAGLAGALELDLQPEGRRY